MQTLLSATEVENISYRVQVPSSKSHSIRALLLASLATGESKIYNLLDSDDVKSCICFLKKLGTHIIVGELCTVVRSKGLLHQLTTQERKKKKKSPKILDIGNSGTTLYFATALVTLGNIPVSFNGDESLQVRSAGPLLNTLCSLGATIIEEGRQGCVPYTIQGPIHINETSIEIECSTSQYLSALLLILSLVEGTHIIKPKLAGEYPYVDMTIEWIHNYLLDSENDNKPFSRISHDESYTNFEIVSKKHGLITPFEETIPGDFSSAAFFLGLAAITGRTLDLYGIKPDSTQADEKVLQILSTMGCKYEWIQNDTEGFSTLFLRISRTKKLKGGIFDLSELPDSLPILAVVASYASEFTLLYNVAHARKKETDRIAVMAKELRRLDIRVDEFSDGLLINPNRNIITENTYHTETAKTYYDSNIKNSVFRYSNKTEKQHSILGLSSGEIQSYNDHRIAMAFAVGAVVAKGEIIIHDADAVAVTFPSFFEVLSKVGVNISHF